MTKQEAEEPFLLLGIKLKETWEVGKKKLLGLCPNCNQKTLYLINSLRIKISKPLSKTAGYCRNCIVNSYRLSEQDIIQELQKLGYKYIKGYINTSKRMFVNCFCGKESQISLDNIRKGRSCGCKRIGSNHHAWIQNRDQYKFNLKIKKTCYSLVSRILSNKPKNLKTKNLLGYTDEELRIHLEKFPILKQYRETNTRWSIDHIFPLKAFEDYGLLNKDFIWLINHLDNLRPLSIKENSRKNSNYSIQEFESYLKKFSLLKTS